MATPYEPDRPVICPYDENHRISQSRIQKHLVKCSRNYPPNYKVSCPHNATHRLFERDLPNHIIQCPDRQFLNRDIYKPTMPGNHASIKSFREMENTSVIECEESWDEESIGMDTANGSICQYEFIHDEDDLEPDWKINRYLANRPPNLTNAPPNLTNRPPKGLPEALMIEESGDSAVEDIESVTSGAGMGRGKPLMIRNLQLLAKLGRGRRSDHSNN